MWEPTLLLVVGWLHTFLVTAAQVKSVYKQSDGAWMFTHLLQHSSSYPPQGVELTEYGVLVVETGSGPRTESPTNAQLFCAFYYPPLFNISGAVFV